jgi:hypothetical protein
MVKTTSGAAVTMASTPDRFFIQANAEEKIKVMLNTSNMTPGMYSLSFVLYDVGEYGVNQNIDVLRDIYSFSILATPEFNHGMSWNSQWWGHFSSGDLTVVS